MATGYSQLNLNIKTTSDLAGVNQLKQQLNEIRTLAKSVDFTGTLNPTQINQMVTAAKQLDAALDAAFDVNLNTINIQKFNQYLRDSKTSLASIQADLAHAGVLGQQAFAQATGQLLRFNTVVKQSNGFLQTMKTSFLNTVRWTVMSSAINEVSSSVRKAYGYVKDLDEALNDIRIVTGKSTEEMQKFAVSANDAAKALAVSTRDYTEGALIYYQQGLDDETVKTLTDVTAKASNVTQQSMETVSEQLTAVWNGYQVANEAAKEGMGIYEEYVDKMAAVGATTASNLEELATAMSKVASAASSMGVGFDELNAQIATIVSVTRQAPESIGTALKTIYARLGDLKVDGVDEFGTTLGDVSGKLQMMGIDVVDMNGNMREMDVVMTEVAEKWDTWTEAQRQAAAVAMAGKRQYNNLIALFDNWDMYSKTLNTAQNAAGTLEEQQSIALDSLDNKLDILTATAEDFYDSLFDEESLKDLVEDLTDIMQVVANVTESIGGLKTILPLVSSLLLKTFGRNIADSLLVFKNNLNAAKLSAMDTKVALSEIQMLYPKIDFVTSTGDNASRLNQGVKDMLSFYQQMVPLKQQMTQQDMQMYNSILDQKVEVTQLNTQLEEEIENYKNLSGLKMASGKGIVFDDKSASGFSGFEELTKGVAIYDQKLQKLNKILDHTSNKLTGATEKDFIKSTQAIQSFFNALNKSGQFDARSLEKLQKTINSFIGTKEKLTPKEFEKIQQILNDFPASAKKVLELENSIKKVQEAAKRAGDSLKQNLDFKKVTQGAINGISAIGQLGSALSSIKNLGSIWQNNDLTFADKLLQTMTNLGFAIPMVVNGFTQLKNARIAILGLTQKETIANLANLGVEAAKLKLEEGQSKQDALQVGLETFFSYLRDDELRDTAVRLAMQEVEEGNLTEINTKLIEQLALRAANNKEGAKIPLPTGQIKESLGNITKGIGNFVKNLGVKLVSFIATPVGAAVAAGLVAIVSIGLVVAKMYHDYTEKLKDAKKETQELADEQKKLTIAAQEQKDAVDKLNESYEELAKQYEDSEITLKELRAKTYDLCLQYEQEDLALQVLMADYEKLNQLMDKAQDKANLDLIKESKIERDTLVNAVSAGFMSDAKESMRDFVDGGQATLDIKTGWGNKEETEIISYLEKEFKIKADNSGHISTQEFSEAVVENYDKIYNKLSSIGGDTAQKLMEIMDASSDNVKRYQEVLANQVAANKDYLVDQYASNVQSLADYTKAYNELVNQAMEDDLFETEEEAMSWAHNQLMSNLEDKSIAISGQLATLIHENTQKEFDVINKEIEHFTKQEQYFLYLQLKLDEDSIKEKYNELDNIVEEYSDYIEGLANKEGADLVSVLLTTEGKTELTDDEVESLFNQKGFEQAIGISQEQFEKVDWLTQRTLMQQYYTSATNEMIKHGEVAAEQGQILIDALEKQRDEFVKNNEDLVAMQDDADAAGVSLDDVLENIKSATFQGTYGTQVDVSKVDTATKNLIAERLDTEVSKLSDQQIYSEVLKLNKELPDLAQNGKTITEIYEAYTNELEAHNTAITEAASNTSALSNAEHDLDEITAMNKGTLSTFTEDLNNIKSTYESLNSVIEDYNDNGKLSIDSVQTLLSLSDEQLMYLSYENGQMSINEDLMKKVLIAKIQNAKATIFETTQEGLKAIAAGKSYDISTKLLGTTSDLTNASLEEADAVAKDGQAWYNLAFAKAQITGVSEEMTADMEAFAETMRKQYLTITDFEKSVSSSNLSSAFGEGKDIKDIYDRYWTLNKELDKLAETLEDLDEIQSHLHSKALIESLEKENELLKEQEETYNRLYEAQKVEAAELRGKLSQYGVKFQDGNVVNYDAAVKGLDEAQYEKFQELFERYDELFYSEMVDTLNKIEEINYERLANELEAFEVQLELNLETTEAERALDEFTKELNKDFKSVYENFDQELKHIVDSYNTYIRKNGTIDSIISAIQTVQKEIDALRDNDDATDSTMFATVGDAQEKLKELQEQLQDATLESRDLMEEYWDTYLDSIDQAAEKFEELSEEFDAINDELDYQRELIELIYGPEAYGMQKQIFNAQINNSLAQVDSARQQVDLWQSYYDQAEEGTEEQLKYAELLKDAQAELNDLTLEHIQLLKDDYANTMDDILTKLEKDITGGLGLDNMKEEWEEAVKESEKYYDNIERIFELETLENKFQNAIDNTASPKYQQAIKDLMEDQLATLKDKEQLTEYDVQLAEKRLGILQAEAALEDAQNAKNAMKLVRGASGNWEYQYVADTSDIENKQQALRESYQELYEFAKDAQLDSIEALMEAKDDYITKLHEIKDDETLSEEEKLIKIAEINDKYWNEEEGIITKLQQDYYNKTQTLSTASAESLLGLYKADESAYYDMTEYEKGLVDEFKHHAETSYTDMYLAIQEEYKQDQEKFDSYVDSNLLHWQTAASDMAAAWNGDEDSIRTNVNEAYESISDATTEYSLELERLESTSGDSFGEEGITGDINTAIDYTNTLKTKTEELVTLANQKLPEYKTQIENIGTAWSDVATKINNASEQLKYYLELSEIEVPEPTTSGDGSGDIGSGNNSGAGSPPGGSAPDTTPSAPSSTPTPEPIEYKVRKKTKVYIPGSYSDNTYIAEGATFAVLGKTEKNGMLYYKIDTSTPRDYKVDSYLDPTYFNTNYITKLDTGGYTGDWSGGEGRMAMLHSKELVLNKVDTENILNAVSAVRDMTGITSSVGSAIMQNIKAMIMEVLGISAGTGHVTRNTNNETSNVFHITAEFPNANSVETIQEAILSLPNIASQYVAENRR